VKTTAKIPHKVPSDPKPPHTAKVVWGFFIGHSLLCLRVREKNFYLTPQGFALYNGRLSLLWFRVKILGKQKPAKAVALRVFELWCEFLGLYLTSGLDHWTALL
jgi:hypothetical protein